MSTRELAVAAYIVLQVQKHMEAGKGAPLSKDHAAERRAYERLGDGR